MTALYIDADACPVREEALRVALRHGVAMYLVSNGGIRPVDHPLVHMVYVDQGADAADRWIADRTGPGDVVVTDDTVLAARCLEGGAQVIKNNGEPLTTANIGQVLALRDLAADLRAADPFRQGGGKPFGKPDRARFSDRLDRALTSARKSAP
ncbi:YaiI/YqxD family protein [Pararhodobacter sp.]|uniref:YaiI/YqxD family protein n=1 Tax=Pararhodobacter sp. TaxID=2127056 RepID=UPI002FDD39FB